MSDSDATVTGLDPTASATRFPHPVKRKPFLIAQPASLRPVRPPVAFLDESYVFTRDGSREPLYVLAAVLIDSHQVESARERARQVVRPAATYHSTDLYHAGQVAKVDAMLEHVRDHAGWSVVAVQSPFAGHADAARQECLRVLLVELSSRKVRRMVLDSRYQPRAADPRKHDKADERTARQLRQSGQIDRSTTISHATDTAEPLLWLPDAGGVGGAPIAVG